MRKLLAISCLCAIAVFSVLLLRTVTGKTIASETMDGSVASDAALSAPAAVRQVANLTARPSLTLYPAPKITAELGFKPSPQTSAEPMSELAYFLQSNSNVMLELIGGYIAGAEQREQGLRRAEKLALALIDKGAPAKQLTKTFAAIADGESLIEMRLFRVSPAALSTASVPLSVRRVRQLWFDEDNQLAQLDAGTRHYMSEMIALLNRRPDLQLKVVGKVDAEPRIPRAAAGALALERAETVAELLTRFGLQPGRASVRSAAQTHQTVANRVAPTGAAAAVELRVVALSL